MSDEKKEFETWEEVIVHFFEYKKKKSNLVKARESIEEKDKAIASEKDEKNVKNL